MKRRNSFPWLLLVLVSTLSLAADAPTTKKKKKLTLLDLLNSSTSSSQRSPTVAGVRGLEETSGDVDTKARDFAALGRLETVVVHDDELKKFIDEGKLR